MKIAFRVFAFLLLMISFSCEDVVQIDLQESTPRLVVEASIIWKKGTNGNYQIIKLTTTKPYFETDYSPATGAIVEIKTPRGETFNFIEEYAGIYTNTNFVPNLNAEYQLTILFNEEIYTASESMIPVVNLEEVEQTFNGGFSGDEIELRAYFSDPAEIPNYYLFKFLLQEDITLQIYEDEFTNGNRTFAYFSDENLEVGDMVSFEMQGISERFYEYLYILSSQAGESNGGPFQTQPTIVRGNIINESNPDNFAFGYFRLSETNNLDYTIQ